MSFIQLLERANGFLDKREFDQAFEEYEAALDAAQTDHERMQAWQMIGIAHRLARQFDDAKHVFVRARLYADSPVDSARIQRDFGMVILDEATQDGGDSARIRVAEKEFLVSRDALILLGDQVESAVSNGFYGRALFLRGAREEAAAALKAAHKVLTVSGNAQYELNNLIWLARASFVARITYAGRALHLSRVLKQPFRWKEYLVVLIGGERLYRFVKARRGV